MAPHPSSLRSQQWLVSALLELLAEKPYASITISEIAERAQLSRRTFYRNFETKGDLLDRHLDVLMEEYIAVVGPVVDRSTSDIVRVHIGFWRRHLGLLRALERDRMLFLLLEQYTARIAEVHARSGSRKYTEADRPEYAFAFNAGGHLSVVFAWLRRGAADSPAEVARAFAGRPDAPAQPERRPLSGAPPRSARGEPAP